MFQFRFPAALIFFLPAFFLLGCTNNFNSALDSAQAAIALRKGAKIETDYISSLPYANSLVTINDGKPVLLILALAKKNTTNGHYRLTWMSEDKGTIVTENGRIIHTTGLLTNNLETLLTVNGDDVPFPSKNNAWQAIYDWSPGYRFNFSATVTSQSLGTEVLRSDLWTQAAEHIQERINFSSLESLFINDYWMVPETIHTKAYIIKSIQYLGPTMDKIEMLMLKPFIERHQNATN